MSMIQWAIHALFIELICRLIELVESVTHSLRLIKWLATTYWQFGFIFKSIIAFLYVKKVKH